MDLDPEDPVPAERKLSKAVVEFGGYIRANATWIPHYGERNRASEAISNAFVESGGQPGREQADGEEATDALDTSRCPPAAAGRTRVLNDELATVFRRWYPEFIPAPAESMLAAA